MKLTIVLKKQDADGLGGDILAGLGMTRSDVEPQVFFTRRAHVDPAEVAPFDATDGMWAIKYMEALMDYGIRPMRVLQRTDSTAGLTPVFASAETPEEPTVSESLDAGLAVATKTSAAEVLDKVLSVRTALRDGAEAISAGTDYEKLAKDAEGPGMAAGFLSQFLAAANNAKSEAKKLVKAAEGLDKKVTNHGMRAVKQHGEAVAAAVKSIK